MAWRVEFDERARKQLAALDESRGTPDRLVPPDADRGGGRPRRIGECLKGSRLGELWRYRVGDYRVIVRIEDTVLRVLVVQIGHRREVYR